MYCPELHEDEEQLVCINNSEKNKKIIYLDHNPDDLIQYTGDIDVDNLLKEIDRLKLQNTELRMYKSIIEANYTSTNVLKPIKKLFDMYAFENKKILSKDAIELKYSLLKLAQYISDKYISIINKEQDK